MHFQFDVGLKKYYGVSIKCIRLTDDTQKG